MERGFSPATSRFASGTTFEAEGKGVSEAEMPWPEAKKTRRRRERKPSVNAGRRSLYNSDVPTAVVTGGAGFLGSHLCEYLLGRGLRVICVDNLVTGSLGNIDHIRDDDFVFLDHDLTEHLGIDEPVDFVYHFAALASPVDYLRMPLHSLKVGSHGTHNALGLAKFKRARFLLASTSEVYGDPQVHPQPETYWGHVNPIGPRGVYDEAKRYAEALTMAYHGQQGVDTGIVRIFNTYGPRMRPHDGRAIPSFVRQALANEPLTVFGDGSQTRSFCYVDDLVRGLVLLAESSEHFPVNIGNPGEFTILELAQAVLEGDGLEQRDRVRGAAGGRSADPPAGHHPCAAGAGLGAGDPARRRAPAHAGKGARRCLARGGSWRRPWRPPPGSACPRPPRPAATAAPDMSIGVYDEGQTFFGNLDQVFSQYKALHVGVLRVNLYWGGPLGVAKHRPFSSSDPRDAAYDWSVYDRTAFYAAASGIKLLFSITGTPRWANGDQSSNRPPRNYAFLRGFAYAAAARYSGTYVGNDGRVLPAVRLWAAWNEPNNPNFLRPQFVKEKGKWVIQSARDYAKICNAVYEGVHATLYKGEQVACGVTAPRGNNNPASARPSVSPVAFLTAAKKAGMKTVRRLRPQPVLRGSDRDADDASAGDEVRAARRPRSRWRTSTS